ncbi:MAG: hypothetical protein NTV52_15895 [Acidobacteria bacterium]|nr:hypothetical protein [Acidobacteriota bacterium]
MTLEPYESAWRDQFNAPPLTLINRALRSHHRRMAVVILAAINTLVSLVIALQNVSFSTPTLGLPLLAVAVLALMIRRQLRLRQAWRNSTYTVSEAMSLSLHDVHQELANQKTLGLYAAATVPLFALLLSQLRTAGKMNQNAVVSLGLLLAAVFPINRIVIGYRRGYTLIPRRDRIERILAQR